VAEHARRAAIQLRILASTVAKEAGLGARLAGTLERIALTLDLTAPAPGEDDRLAGQLAEALRGRLREARRAERAFQEGRVFCFQCDRVDCLHADPPGPTQVFAGYAPTGRPTWQELSSLCLALGEPRVDRLYGDPPEVIVLCQDAVALAGELLPAFGGVGAAYAVRGQVVAGLVPDSLEPTDRSRERRAIALQVVETRLTDPAQRLQLNLLGFDAEHVAALSVGRDPRSGAERLRRTIQSLRQRLRMLSDEIAAEEARGGPADVPARVRPLVARLRGEVQRALQGLGQRTAHAHERHLGGERPTATAVQDALKAAEDRYLRDTRRGTVVIVGPKSRAHVFALDGRHVTSLLLMPGELERRTVRGRWVPLERSEVEGLRERLRQGLARRGK
jgi:hypothetical protein